MKQIVGILAALAVLALAGCDGSGGGGGWEVAAEVDTEDGVTTSALVVIVDDTDIMDDATVTINGEDVAFFFAFYWNLGGLTLIEGGDPATLVISGSGLSINETLTMPDPVTVLTADHSAGTVTVTWTPPVTAPDTIRLVVPKTETVSGEDYTVTLPGTATGTTFPAAILLPGPANVKVATVETVTLSTGSSSFYAVANVVSEAIANL